MKEIAYPALFRLDEEEPKFINVTFPDIWGANTFGEGLLDAIYMAKDLLEVMLETAPAQCEPPHTLEYTQNNFPNDKVIMIKVRFDDSNGGK